MRITSLEHVTLVVHDLTAAVDSYRSILAVAESARGDHDGITGATFSFAGSRLQIVSPVGAGGVADTLRQHLASRGEGLSGLGFAVADLGLAYKRLRRLSMTRERDESSPDSLLINNAMTGGLDIAFMPAEGRSAPPAISEAPINGIDLVVVQTRRPDRAAALYGARLGLDMVFDRVMGQGDTRLMQFACGNQMVEVTHRLADADKDEPDRLWGIAWDVSDIDATQARLAASGRNVSAVKSGAKPGTRVCTLRDGTCGVPTLIVETRMNG